MKTKVTIRKTRIPEPAPSLQLCAFRGVELDGSPTSCGEKAVAQGLCRGHYSQQRRNPGKPLTPLRAAKLVTLTGPLRVSEACAVAVKQAAEAAGVTPYEIQQRILEAWARRETVGPDGEGLAGLVLRGE